MTVMTTAPAVTAERDRLPRVEQHRLITAYLPLARSIAYDYLSRAPRADRDEIISAAFLGLVEAAHRYNPNTAVPFAKWAPIRIRGAIGDAARAADPLSKQARQSVKTMHAAEDELSQQLGGSVTDEALADQLGWDVRTIRDARAQFHRAVTTSLDADAGEDGESFSVRLIDADPTPLERLERAELDRYVVDAVDTLPERLQDVVCSYYLRGESSAETAERLELTTQRVGQLRKEALLMLRAGINAQYEEIYERTATGPEPAPTAPAPAAGPAAARQAARLASYASAVALRSSYAQRVSL